ncbi:hypothetical protein [Urbanus proteus nucleopolyhedrovirus]|uniref:Chitin-binding type-2 domain-containing protein n=1 Tax=Urbanus proteus nucleopolyhedrovirus TaxID=1675866 RepID=A0A162GV05_9ABAC|nr:hypothetical protein [Urbanus proteus nucleopolyhedrovirus]AKR17384.1 hypothetical protein [Urbanus proteus nucleopolyhedrovirus]
MNVSIGFIVCVLICIILYIILVNKLPPVIPKPPQIPKPPEPPTTPDSPKPIQIGHNFPPAALESFENFKEYIKTYCEVNNLPNHKFNNPIDPKRKCFTYYLCDARLLHCFSDEFFSYHNQECVNYERSDCGLLGIKG